VTTLRSFVLALCMMLLGLSSPAQAGDTVSTFTLDAFSYISFGDQQIVLPDYGSTIRFRFGDANADGSVPVTIQPPDVAIDPIPLPSGDGTLRYSIVSPATGVLRDTPDGKKLEFTATIRAELSSTEANGSFDYTMTFTTESAQASSQDGSETLSVEGMRLLDGVWYGRIVGATTNHENAFPEPGAAVYSVLSGTFDQVP